MMKVFLLVIVALCVIYATADTRCSQTGFQDNAFLTSIETNKAPCYSCEYFLRDCDADDPTLMVFRDQISTEAYTLDNDIHTLKCQSPHLYNPETKQCDNSCAIGCSSCYGTTTFCTDCHPGWVWSPFECTPAVIGISATALAILIIAMIFGIVIIVRLGKRGP